MTSRAWQPAGAITLVVLTGALLVLGRPGAPADARATTRVVGESATFGVGARWSAQRAGAVLYYADTAGRPVAALTDAVVADAGSCAGRAASSRGFAGFAAPEAASRGGDLAGAHAAALARWTTGIGGRPRSRPAAPVLLGDGTAGLRSVVRLRAPPDDDPCTASRVVLDLVSLATGTDVTLFVVVRDLDPRGVGDAEVEAMVQSLRSRT